MATCQFKTLKVLVKHKKDVLGEIQGSVQSSETTTEHLMSPVVEDGLNKMFQHLRQNISKLLKKRADKSGS